MFGFLSSIFCYESSVGTQLGSQGLSLTKSCGPLFVAIVNPTNDNLELIGNKNKFSISAHSAGEYKINQKHYYTSCGRFDVKIKSAVRKMLVERGKGRVSLRYKGNGQFSTEGVRLDNIDKYVQWNGLSSVL